jgi:hypothetical protein
MTDQQPGGSGAGGTAEHCMCSMTIQPHRHTLLTSDVPTVEDQLRADLEAARQENRVLRAIIAKHPGVQQAVDAAKAAIEAGDTITLEELEAEFRGAQ